MIQTILSTILFVGTGFVMLAPQVTVIRKVSEYSVHIMLGMLIFSMAAMVFNQRKVMYSGLACTAALCIFLKNASLNTLNYSVVNTESKINVAHINLGNISTAEFEEVLQMFDAEEIDLVSFQELTPDWSMFLHNELNHIYPYHKSEVRIDPFGLAIFSKAPLVESDTFLCDGIPNMNVIVEIDEKNFQVISSYLVPALDNKGLDIAAKQLGTIAEKVNDSKTPLLALGEFNMVYWAAEIRSFRAETNLQNSRRDLVDGNLRVPYDHIFFSEGLECTQFKEIKGQSQNYIGIMGTYQIKKDEIDFEGIDSQLSLNES